MLLHVKLKSRKTKTQKAIININQLFYFPEYGLSKDPNIVLSKHDILFSHSLRSNTYMIVLNLYTTSNLNCILKTIYTISITNACFF